MKLSTFKSFVGLLAATVVMSSCAKVNYDLAKVGGLGGPGGLNKLGIQAGGECTITEGNANEICPLKMDAVAQADADYSWTIISTQNDGVEPSTRVQTLSGVAKLLKGEAELKLNLTAAAADSIAQGTKIFGIKIKPVGSNLEGSAKLTVLDLNGAPPPVVNLPLLSFVDKAVVSDKKMSAQLAVKLSGVAATDDVYFNICLGDKENKDTAAIGRDYNGFKIPGESAVRCLKNVQFPKALPNKQFSLPEISIIQNKACRETRSFTAVIEKVSVRNATIEENTATVTIPCDPVEIKLADGQKFEMFEGESQKFTLKFVNVFPYDMDIDWSLISPDSEPANVKFSNASGTVKAIAGTSEVVISVIGTEMNPLKESDKVYSIDLGSSGSAALLLKDLVVAAPKATIKNPINAKLGAESNKATINLDKPAGKGGVVIKIKSQDGTAISSGPRAHYKAIDIVITILEGQSVGEIPIEVLRNECEAKQFTLVVEEIAGADMSVRTAPVAIAADADPRRCSPPPASQPPAPKPDAAL